jgi:hypothetical protein
MLTPVLAPVLAPMLTQHWKSRKFRLYDGHRAFEVSRIFGHCGSTNGDRGACKFPKFLDVRETTAEVRIATRDRLSWSNFWF